jgi:membrane-bound lytic murein transglycosylase MltF
MNRLFVMRRLALALCALALAPRTRAEPAASPPGPATSDAEVRRLTTEFRAWTGDFDAMLERRVIRVLVPYSRSLYYNEHGRERGISAEHVRAFERWLNERHAKRLGNRPFTVVIRPTTRDRLLPDVAAGLGDVAVGNLTVTPRRLEVVDFVESPDQPPVQEVAVTGPRSPSLATADDLAGKTVHVRRASSYFENLEALNRRFEAEGKPAVKLVLVPDALEDEDMLEMLDAGILEVVVVDDWKGRMWAQILPSLRVNDGVVVQAGSRVGWGIRKGSPMLAAEVLAYMKAEGKRGSLEGRLQQQGRRVKKLRNPAAGAERKRLEQIFALFEKYGARYRFDPLMLAAQGYQESRLNQDARSPVGAIGVMQVMPATGESLRVGDIRLTEPNIHAGAKYMDQLMTRYFPDAGFDAPNRTLFAFASYNAGPGAIARMRKAAAKSGLDPDRWFNNVEMVTAQKIGLETTTYVRNIYKYYVAYALVEETRAAAARARAEWAEPPR